MDSREPEPETDEPLGREVDDEGPTVRELLRQWVPLWSEFSYVGKSAILRSSFVWVFLVPLVSKGLAAVGPELPPSIGAMKLHLGLPFTLKILYYSAVVFAGASFLYGRFCPFIVRRYDHFGDWTREGKGARQVIEELVSVLYRGPRLSEDHRRAVLLKLVDRAHGRVKPGTDIDNDPTWEIGERLSISDENRADAFWYVRMYADTLYPALRIACGILYGAGFLLLGWLCWHNFKYVWRFTWS